MSTGQFSLTDIDPPKASSGTGQFSLSDVDSLNPASTPGAFQTRKGGSILNSNSPASPSAAPQPSVDVDAAQGVIHAVSGITPGGDAAAGAVKGLYKTGIGGASLLAKALNKVGIHGEEIDRLSRGDLSPFSHAMTQPEGFEQHAGATAEEMAEWLAGEEGLKAVQSLAKIPQAGRLVKSLLNIGKSATIGAAQGGVKGAADGNATGGAESGAIGGALGGTVGEVAPVVTEKLGEHLERYAPDFINSLLRTKKGNFLYGKNPGQAIIDEKLSVPKSLSLSGQLENLHGQLESAGNQLDSQIKQTLVDPKVAALKQDVAPSIQKAISDAKTYITNQSGIDVPAYIEALDDLEKSVLTKYDVTGKPIGTLKPDMTPAEVSDLKKSIGKNTQWKLNPLDPQLQMKGYLNKTRQRIYGELADTVEQAAEKGAPGSNIKGLNARYANAIEAQGLLENRIAQEHGTGGYNAAVRKGEWITALGALATGHPYIGLPLLADRITRSVPGRVLEAQGSSAVGKALQSPAIEKAAQVAKPAIADAWIHFRSSDGQEYQVHPEDYAEIQKRDPGAQQIQSDSANTKWIRYALSDGRHIEIHPEDASELEKRDPKATVVQ